MLKLINMENIIFSDSFNSKLSKKTNIGKRYKIKNPRANLNPLYPKTIAKNNTNSKDIKIISIYFFI